LYFSRLPKNLSSLSLAAKPERKTPLDAFLSYPGEAEKSVGCFVKISCELFKLFSAASAFSAVKISKNFEDDSHL